MKVKLGTLMNPDNDQSPMSIYYNGRENAMTAENDHVTEELAYSPADLPDAVKTAEKMYGNWPWEYEPEDVRYVWFAYQKTEEERKEGCWDSDGTEDIEEAVQWLKDQLEAGNPDAQVVSLDCESDWTANVALEIVTAADTTNCVFDLNGMHERAFGLA